MSYGEALSPKQKLVLHHIGRYGLSFVEAIEHICFGGKSSRKSIEGLATGDTPMVERVGAGFKGKRKALTLTAAGSRAVYGDTGRSKKPTYANKNLFAFCCLSGKRRIRLEDSEVNDYFGNPLPGKHLVMNCSSFYCLHSLYIPNESTKDATIIAKVESRFGELLEADNTAWSPSIESWLASGRLRVTALVETKPKAARINKALQKRLRNFEVAGIDNCRAIASGYDQLEESLNGLKSR